MSPPRRPAREAGFIISGMEDKTTTDSAAAKPSAKRRKDGGVTHRAGQIERKKRNAGWNGALQGAGYRPGHIDEWLATVPAPAVEPTQDELVAAEDVFVHANADLGPEDPPVRIHERFRRFYKPMLVALGAYAAGVKVADIEARCGMTWTRLTIFGSCDKPGWGRLWKEADRIRRETISQRVRDKAVQRVMDGDEVPMIGRVDKDVDGVVATKRVFSDRLTEYLIDEVKPAPERSTVQPGTGSTQIVGQQIVYNLPELPGWLPSAPPAKPVIDVTPGNG